MDSEDDFFDEFGEEIEFEKKEVTVSLKVTTALHNTFHREVPSSIKTKLYAKWRNDMKRAIYDQRFDPNKVETYE